ncbi:hypothetical protein ACFX1S_012932 [Malus domestica]
MSGASFCVPGGYPSRPLYGRPWQMTCRRARSDGGNVRSFAGPGPQYPSAGSHFGLCFIGSRVQSPPVKYRCSG